MGETKQIKLNIKSRGMVHGPCGTTVTDEYGRILEARSVEWRMDAADRVPVIVLELPASAHHIDIRSEQDDA